MNRTELRPYAPAELEAFEARLALRMTARLTEKTATLPQDVTERLRFAREQALQRAQASRAAMPTASSAADNGSGTLSLGGPPRGAGWWMQLAAWVPLVALVAGLVLIQRLHVQSQISAAAEIDASILADDLPPAAYSDPGFVEFLKTPRD
jgi:hypothetical protein